MLLNRVPRYYHTLRYLRPVQVYGRAWYRLRPCPAPSTAPAPPARWPRNGHPPAGWIAAPPARVPSLVGPTTFRFLNQTRDIAREEGGWNLLSAPEKLWLLNLHYFDDLNATGAGQRMEWHQALLERWVRENPPGMGIGWRDSYAVSLRIVNWIKWALAGNVLPADVLHSLAVQVRHLRQNLETYLLGNHVLANAKALIFAGAFFTGNEATEDWLATGLTLLHRELAEEILPDGGHYERSPMYHSIVLEDVLDLCNLAAIRPEWIPPRWRAFASTWPAVAGRMLAWLKVMCHPDGEIAFFNDAAHGIAPTRTELEGYAKRLGMPAAAEPGDGLTHLPISGYIRWQCGDDVALLDVGEIGPDHIPGHAHADTLSFELSIAGRRALVNSGTSAYKVEPARSRERGTGAHNTVVVDGQDSSEVWGAFRVARRARPVALRIEEKSDGPGAAVTCAHDGYQRLPGRVLHRRTWRFRPGRLEIEDHLGGRYGHAEARFHLHPMRQPLAATVAGEERTAAEPMAVPAIDGPTLWVTMDGVASVTAQPGTFHPQFGVSEPNHCLVVAFPSTRGIAEGSLVRTAFRWERAVRRMDSL